MTDDQLQERLDKHKLAFLVRINYKSGITQEFWCSDFDCDKRGGSITSLSWKNIPGLLMPLDIAHDLSDVESIYQIEARPLEAVLDEGREAIERLIEYCESFNEDKS